MKILDGKLVSNLVKENLKKRIQNMDITPGLGVILVGNRPDSATYVRMKRRACDKLGIYDHLVELPETINQDELIEEIEKLNNNTDIHGILVQLPLPSHIDKVTVLNKIRLDKDVDGFHVESMGNLALNRNPQFIPCTPKGCMYLLDHYNIQIQGKRAVVIGKSNLVGLPMSLLLLHRGATVTICHSKTQNIEEIVRQADILIVACGRAHMVKKEWVKEGVVIVDVGINSIDDATRKRGYRLVGDVDFENVKELASYITPVPGGVGPMTIAMLLEQTVSACETI